MSFEPITTQEQLDEILGGRLSRAKEKAIAETEAKYADYTDLKTKAETLEREAQDNLAKLNEAIEARASLEAKVHKYEMDSVKTRVTLEAGLPIEFADRLTGTTEEEIKHDATILAGLVKPVRDKAPIGSAEKPVGGNTTSDAFKEMLGSLKGE